MRVMGYDITVEVDGVESVVQLDDTYPSIKDWHSATEFAMALADHVHPEANIINFVECAEFEMDEYKSYDYIHEAPVALQ
jgi:hypothetical protein